VKETAVQVINRHPLKALSCRTTKLSCRRRDDNRNPTTYFTAVSCSAWFGIKPLLMIYDLFTNTNTFKPQFELDAFDTNTSSLK
jgi:hypothetical protein